MNSNKMFTKVQQIYTKKLDESFSQLIFSSKNFEYLQASTWNNDLLFFHGQEKL